MTSKSITTQPDPPYRGGTTDPHALVPALVLLHAPDRRRIGQVAYLHPPTSVICRGDETPRWLEWWMLRPGATIHAPVPYLESETLSRRAVVEIDLMFGKMIAVRRTGEKRLFAEGEERQNTVASPGCTFALGPDHAFLYTLLPRAFPSLKSPPPSLHPHGEPDGDGIVGETWESWELRDRVAIVGPSTQNTLVLGESGTGKELVARALHRRSNRAAGPFVARNMATLEKGLGYSELFGVAKNHTHQTAAGMLGLVASADGGTLFLDEIGELSTELQAALLRFVETGVYKPYGAK
jgi:hypothetical protein